MKVKSILSIMVLTGVINAAFAFGGPDITGTYNCTGYDPTSTPPNYSGKITIIKQGEGYSIQEVDPEPTSSALTYQEVGMLKDNVLSVAFQQAETNTFGIQTYEISQGGKKLVGPFIYWGKFAQQGTETCEKS